MGISFREWRINMFILHNRHAANHATKPALLADLPTDIFWYVPV
jgi:hypothetical protein